MLRREVSRVVFGKFKFFWSSRVGAGTPLYYPRQALYICPRVALHSDPPVGKSTARAGLLVALLILPALLLFVRLGHYAFWDDEAITALGAKGVLLTGNTSVLMDYGNIVAYRSGAIVSGFCDRVDPPLENYVAATSFALFSPGTWAGRGPFAAVGLGIFALALLWVRRESWLVVATVFLGFSDNVSLILFCRQCRYYALAIFFTTAIGYIYWRWKPTPRNLLILAALSVLLFASNYLNYIALYGCLAVDYLIWKRREWPPTWRNAALLFGPQILLNGIVGFIWNPLRTAYGGSVWQNNLGDRLTLFLWYLRDMNAAEFMSVPLLFLALGTGLYLRQSWLVRGCMFIALYVAVITMLSPQPVARTVYADVRYVAPLIPLGIALEAGTILALFARWPWAAIAASVVIFGTNLGNGGPLLDPGFRSTVLSYLGELRDPIPGPYAPTAAWINANVPTGGTVWVQPDYATYPLMFHAPRALYAWQLAWPPRPDFAALPRVHFIGIDPPDYLVAFGPALAQIADEFRQLNRPDVAYEHVATIDTFWHDTYRPELFWRTFKPVTGFDPERDTISIFRRTKPPIAARP